MYLDILCGFTVKRTVRIPIRFLKVHFLFLFVFAGLNSPAQVPDLSEVKVSILVQNAPLQSVLYELEKQIPYRFAFNSELVARHKNITIEASNMQLDSVLHQILSESLGYSIIGNQIVLKDIAGQSRVTISGFVRDSISGEALPQAILYIPDKGLSTSSNNYGFYSITLDKADSVNVLVSYIGYGETSASVNFRNSAAMNFYLPEKSTQINSIVIKKTNTDDNVRKVPPGRMDIAIEQLKRTPSLGGNGDILGTVQMMPGVIAGLDGRPGYFIRGGNTDQNLVQLDEATLYNPVHLLGLISIFNPSAIKSAYLLKAGFPASFGDHLSSVLDITMKEGNSRGFEGDFHAGTITTGATISGPLINNKNSFFVSARRSTIDLLLRPLDISNYYTEYKFYDVNAKLNFRVTDKDRIYLSFYQGRDNTAYSNDSSFNGTINYRLNYGNRAAVMRWNHIFTSKIFANTSVIYNNYFHDVTARQNIYSARLYSGIRDINFKTDFYFYPSLKHRISTGINYLFQTQYPSAVSNVEYVADSSEIHPSQIPRKYARRIAAYFGDEYKISPRFSVYIGARVPLYFTEDANFILFEPRLLFIHVINPSTSIKISYTKMHQFLNRAQSFNSAFPAEIWIGSGKNIKPQNSTEASVGLFKNLHDDMFHASFELYYKQMGNQVLFRTGSEPAFNSNLDSLLVFGSGKSYGAEVYIGKKTGRLTGWMAYTLAKTSQKFDSLNLGKSFPFSGDRRHSLYFSASYSINENWQISSNFVYASGSAFTAFNEVETSPYNPMYYDNVTGKVPNKGDLQNRVQNNFRLDAYHRLDIGISYRKTRDLNFRKLETEWVLSVYNVYARRNTFFAYCSIDPVTQKPIPVQVSFVPVIPSLSFYLRF